MGTNNLKIEIFDSVEEAPNYEKPIVAVSLDIARIVKNGTVEGNPTVDLVLTDEAGVQYVAMVTGGIIKMLASAIEGSE